MLNDVLKLISYILAFICFYIIYVKYTQTKFLT